MFGFLRGGDQGGVAFFVFDYFLRFLDEAFHSFALLTARWLFECREDLSQAPDLVRSLTLMLLKGGAQSFVLRGLGHFGQRFEQLHLGVQQIF